MRFVPIQLAIIASFILAPFHDLAADTGTPVNPAFVIPGSDSAEGKKILAKMNSIIIPRIDLDKLDISNVAEFMTIKSKELDPEHLGIQFRLELPLEPDSRLHRQVSVVLTNVPLQDVLGFVLAQTNLRLKIVKGSAVLYLPEAAQ